MVSRLLFSVLLILAAGAAPALERSLRPEARGAAAIPPTRAAEAGIVQVQSSVQAGFARWIADFRGRAAAQGIRQDIFDAAFRNVRYNVEVIEKDRNQAEFVRPIWDYLASAVSDSRITTGRQALRQYVPVLDVIEARYGVDREVVVAIWGMESAYGARRGEFNVIEALATLAYDGRRGKFFEEQLIAALKILQNGDTAPSRMTGSWAGAMGHTQFIPTSYLAYAADLDGDGRRDIWSDDPGDALASTAAYLARFGWRKGQPWGVEVRLPRGFDYSQADRAVKRMPSDWARAGVAGLDGRAVPDYGAASILLPAGARGAAFMIFDNFKVISRYNSADAYVIGVGHLSDRLRGAGPIQADWPRGDRELVAAERAELQQRLTAAGYSTQGIDGQIGPRTTAAIRAYQQARGLIPDGHASLQLLQHLR